MDRRRAELEELPELELQRLRDLDLAEPSRPGRPATLAAASGVARRGDFVYVIGDDELFLAVFRASDPGPGRLRRVLQGELSVDPDERAGQKPDLEALTLLPPHDDAPFGALLGLGSGSGPGRDRAFAWPLAVDGSLRGEPREIDFAPLYDRLREDISGLNIEGAAVMGERLWLLQRGEGEDAQNLVVELDLDDLLGSLHGDHRIDACELAAVRAYELGDLEGVPLTFSDGTPLGRDVLVFTASAEAEDGHIAGSVLGTLDLDGNVQRLRTIDRQWKVEGVHASLEPGVMDLLLVCDQDDPDAPSPLLSASMPLDPRFERG